MVGGSVNVSVDGSVSAGGRAATMSEWSELKKNKRTITDTKIINCKLSVLICKKS